MPRFEAFSSLVSYGPSLTQMWRKAAVYVDKILKGRTRQSCQSWNLAKSQNSRGARPDLSRHSVSPRR
jgi:hypothetical protein